MSAERRERPLRATRRADPHHRAAEVRRAHRVARDAHGIAQLSGQQRDALESEPPHAPEHLAPDRRAQHPVLLVEGRDREGRYERGEVVDPHGIPGARADLAHRDTTASDVLDDLALVVRVARVASLSLTDPELAAGELGHAPHEDVDVATAVIAARELEDGDLAAAGAARLVGGPTAATA